MWRHTRAHTCAHTHARTHAHTRARTPTHTRAHARTHTHTHQTHIHIRSTTLTPRPPSLPTPPPHAAQSHGTRPSTRRRTQKKCSPLRTRTSVTPHTSVHPRHGRQCRDTRRRARTYNTYSSARRTRAEDARTGTYRHARTGSIPGVDMDGMHTRVWAGTTQGAARAADRPFCIETCGASSPAHLDAACRRERRSALSQPLPKASLTAACAPLPRVRHRPPRVRCRRACAADRRAAAAEAAAAAHRRRLS